jgi:diketogulonate reductase-like aldo/keto reductase
MPYASGRNIKSLPSVTLELLESVSRAHNASKHATVSQLFLQTGAVVIPRATHERHLQENLGLLSWELQRTEIVALGWKAPLDEERVAVEVDPQS